MCFFLSISLFFFPLKKMYIIYFESLCCDAVGSLSMASMISRASCSDDWLAAHKATVRVPRATNRFGRRFDLVRRVRRDPRRAAFLATRAYRSGSSRSAARGLLRALFRVDLGITSFCFYVVCFDFFCRLLRYTLESFSSPPQQQQQHSTVNKNKLDTHALVEKKTKLCVC